MFNADRQPHQQAVGIITRLMAEGVLSEGEGDNLLRHVIAADAIATISVAIDDALAGTIFDTHQRRGGRRWR